MLPQYLEKAVPNPASNRGPWYANTAPSYAGIFLWIAFYNQLAGSTLAIGSVGVCLVALAVAGLLCYALYYKVPAMLGMQTGYPLYVVGSSTFGTKGGYIMPGLLMGLLQIGWFAVGTFVSASFILKGVGADATPGTVPFIAIGILWGVSMGWLGVKGIQYVAKVSTILNFIPLLMLLIVFFQTAGGIGSYQVPAGKENTWGAFTAVIAIVIGFFATAGAAGTDFGMNSRNARDVKMGGLVGIALAVMIAAGLPLMSVAGAHGLNPSANLGWDYDAVIQNMGGFLASAMFFLFTVASIPPACFCAFIAGNSFSTMIPGVPRVGSTMAGVAVAVILAVTGIAGQIIWFFGLVGASFGPICGAMAADYILSGRKWAGPREGVNIPGYAAWAVGFLVGILPKLPVPDALKVEPAVLFSFFAGFIVYYVLAKAGMESKTVAMPAAAKTSA
jgi:cytosine permease